MPRACMAAKPSRPRASTSRATMTSIRPAPRWARPGPRRKEESGTIQHMVKGISMLAALIGPGQGQAAGALQQYRPGVAGLLTTQPEGQPLAAVSLATKADLPPRYTLAVVGDDPCRGRLAQAQDALRGHALTAVAAIVLEQHPANAPGAGTSAIPGPATGDDGAPRLDALGRGQARQPGDGHHGQHPANGKDHQQLDQGKSRSSRHGHLPYHA